MLLDIDSGGGKDTAGLVLGGGGQERAGLWRDRRESAGDAGAAAFLDVRADRVWAEPEFAGSPGCVRAAAFRFRGHQAGHG